MITFRFKRSFRCRTGLFVATAMISAVLSGGGAVHAQTQSKQKSKESIKKEGEQLFKPATKASGKSSKSSAVWSILIVGFRGDDQEVEASKALEKVRTQAGLTEAYMEKRGIATVVAYGSFVDGESKETRAALAKVRNTEVTIGGIKTKPFADAFLAPPAEIPGSLPEFDLRQAKTRNGPWALYTLQVGVYTRRDKAPTAKDLAEFRKTAEMAVTKLRREGEQAFYYHGPTGSTVSIGLFGEEDFKPDEPGIESPTLAALRKRHPHNLYNGQGMRETITINDQNGKQVKTTRMQSSGLVVVPKSD